MLQTVIFLNRYAGTIDDLNFLNLLDSFAPVESQRLHHRTIVKAIKIYRLPRVCVNLVLVPRWDAEGVSSFPRKHFFANCRTSRTFNDMIDD